jgi:aspartyl protease family protein
MLFWPVVIIVLTVLAMLLSEPAPDAVVVGGHTDMRVIYLTLLAAALAVAGLGRMLLRAGRRTTLHVAIWTGAVAGLVTAFVFRDEAHVLIREIHAELMPSVALSRTAGEAELRRGWDGHYRAQAEVNGAPLKLMIDTGASMVLIPYEHAVEIGFDPETLNYSMPVTTANGRSAVAPVQLASIRVGQIEVHDIDAAIAQPGRLKTGLLGMSFLDKLAETSFQGEKLILRSRNRDESGYFRSFSADD